MILLKPASLDRFADKLTSRDCDGTAALQERMALLHPRDRLLLEMALKHHLTRRQIGIVLGISAGNVSRKLRRLLNRLHDPLVVALCDQECPLAEEYRQLGLKHFLHDVPASELARAKAISEIQVRGMLEYIRGWHRGWMARR